jgi:hypothetical protein
LATVATPSEMSDDAHVCRSRCHHDLRPMRVTVDVQTDVTALDAATLDLIFG